MAEKAKGTARAKPALINKISLAQRIEQVNKEYAVILRGSQVLIMRHWIGEDGKAHLVFLNKRDFTLLMENQRVIAESSDGAVKYVPLAKCWLESGARQQYEEIYFRPCDKPYATRYNLWRGFGVEARPGGEYDLLLRHIEDNICGGNQEHYAWVIDWLADMVQKPWRKPGTAIVLRGKMGIGKGSFAYHIGKLFGIHYMPIIQGGQITGRFNSHMSDKVFVFIDESGWSQDKNGAGILRALITEPEVTIEMKNKDALTMDNYTRFVIAANNEWVVPVGMHDERRFAVFDVGEMKRGDAAYFNAIAQQMENGGYEALLHFLMNHKYEDSAPRTIPQTQGLLEQKLHSMSIEAKWWADCLAFERIGDLNFPEDDFEMIVETNRLYKSYSDFCLHQKTAPCDNRTLGKRMRKFASIVKERKGIATERIYIYNIAGLAKSREIFEAEIGQKMDW